MRWRHSVTRGSNGAGTAEIARLLLIRHHVVRPLLWEVAGASWCHRAEGIRGEGNHLPAIAMMRGPISASDALGSWITPPSVKSCVLWRRETSRAVHRIFIRFAAHGLHMIWWWWHPISWLPGNAVLARWVARRPTVRSWLDVLSRRGCRVVRVYVVFGMRRIALLRRRIGVCVLRLALLVCDRRP